MFIRTTRLLLRPVFPEDWRAVLAALSDVAVVRMLARVPWPYTAADAQAFCNRASQPGEWRFAIALPESAGAPLIGTIVIGPLGENPHELGYWIGARWHGHGYATEAARAVLHTARACGRTRIEAGHFIDSPASGRVLRKCGFVETGTLVQTPCAGRAGAVVPGQRYVCDLAGEIRSTVA